MRKIFTLLAVAMMAVCAQAQEKFLFSPTETYTDGQVIEASANVTVTVGPDGKLSKKNFTAGETNAEFAQTYTNADGEQTTQIVYLTGGNNPKDGALDGTASTGSGYKPESKNNPQSGMFFVLSTKKAGAMTAGIILNSGKSFYVTKSDGTALPTSELELISPEGETVTLDENNQSADKFYGLVKFQAEAGESYYLFCTGSKISFYGYIFAPEGEGGSGAATFEEMTLEAESSYNGAGAQGETITDNYGSQVVKSSFVSGGYRFTTLYNPEWFSWSGFAVSNETSTTYANYADQYRNCLGTGYKGSANYAVAFPSAMKEAVEPVGGAQTISGMYVTNSAWNVYAYTVGDGMTPGAFATGDWCKLTITGIHADDSQATIDVYLADYRSANEADHYYIDRWQWVDLSTLGEVKSVTFEISSSRNNDWGMTTPGYFCMDNFGGEPDESAGICHSIIATSTGTTTIHTLDGKTVASPQRGINVVRMSDGTVRKVMVK